VDHVDLVAVEEEGQVVVERHDGKGRRRRGRNGLLLAQELEELFAGEALANVVVGDDHGARAAERGVAARVVPVHVRVDDEAHGLLRESGQRGAQLGATGSRASSTTRTPSSPTETATLPPENPSAPSIIEIPAVTGVVLRVTFVGSPII